MRKRTPAVLLTIVLLLAAALTLLAVGDDIALSTTNLQRRAPMVDEGDVGFDEYFVELVGEEGEVVAVAGAEVDPRADDLYWMRVSVWHKQGTVLDRLTVRLNMDQIAPEVALVTPGGSWPPIQYQQTRDARGVLVEIPDLGIQGRGTVTLEFFLGGPLTGSPPEQIDLDLAFTLHEEGTIQLQRQVGEVSIPVPLQ